MAIKTKQEIEEEQRRREELKRRDQLKKASGSFDPKADPIREIAAEKSKARAKTAELNKKPVTNEQGLIDPNPRVANIRQSGPEPTTQAELDERRRRQANTDEVEEFNLIQAGARGPGIDQSAVDPLTQRGQGEVAELQENIDQPPELAPPSVLETTAGVGLGIPSEINPSNRLPSPQDIILGKALGIDFTTGPDTGEFAKTKLGKIIGNLNLAGAAAALGLSGQAVAAAAGPAVAQTSIGAFVGTSIGKLVGISVLGGLVDQLTRGKIGTARKIIAGMVEEGERIEADVRNGLDPNFAIDRLTEMADQIDNAEEVIKNKGKFDITYRLSDAYLADQQAIVKSREALRRRFDAVINIANTGTAALNPEALMLNAAIRTEEESKI